MDKRSFLKFGIAAGTAGFSIGAAAKSNFKFKYAHNAPTDHPLHIHAARACEKIAQRTNNAVQIDVFPNNQLSGDTEMLSQLRAGAIQFQTLSTLILSNVVPSSSISGVGFAFKNYDEVWAAMDGKLGGLIRADIEKAGLVPMEKMYDNGFRQITNNVKPIVTARDLEGLKIRVPVSPMWLSLFKSLGAAPTSINWSDTYVALQTKVVDGQENPLGFINLAKLYEVQQFCSKSNHMWDGMWFLANGKAWASMPEDLRKVCADAFNEEAIAQRKTNENLNNNTEQTLRGKGLKFNDVDVASFKAQLRSSGFYADWKEKFPKEIWAAFESATGATS